MEKETTQGFIPIRKEFEKKSPKARTSLSRKSFEPAKDKKHFFDDVMLVELDQLKTPSKETKTIRVHFANKGSAEVLLNMLKPHFKRKGITNTNIIESNSEGAKFALSVEYPADDDLYHLVVMHRLEFGPDMGDFMTPVKVKKN